MSPEFSNQFDRVFNDAYWRRVESGKHDAGYALLGEPAVTEAPHYTEMAPATPAPPKVTILSLEVDNFDLAEKVTYGMYTVFAAGAAIMLAAIVATSCNSSATAEPRPAAPATEQSPATYAQ